MWNRSRKVIARAVPERATDDGDDGDSDEVSETGKEEGDKMSGIPGAAGEVAGDIKDVGKTDGDKKAEGVMSKRSFCPAGEVSWACKPRPKKSTIPQRIASRVRMSIMGDWKCLDF
jgi:hypothetical protein